MMDDATLNELIDNICNASYTKEVCGHTDEYTIVSRYSNSRTQERAAITQAVYGWAAKRLDDTELRKKVGELEAKCYAYEKIIANSNFAPMIIREPEPTPDISKMAEMVVDGFPE